MIRVFKSIVRAFTSPAMRKSMRRQFERVVLARVYRGRRFQCPICQWSFRKLLPGGYNGRPNARCPRCGAFERHRTLFFLLQEIKLKSPTLDAVLHIAPEPAIATALKSLWSLVRYVTLDLHLPNVDHRCSVTEIPCGDDTFDLVICSHVLQEVPAYQQAIAELHRVLKPGGDLLLQDPYRFDAGTIDRDRLSKPEVQHFFGRAPVLRIFGKDFVELLATIGFDIDIYDPEQRLPEDVRERNRLKEPVVVCRKNLNHNKKDTTTKSEARRADC